jgi:hypothetical protein
MKYYFYDIIFAKQTIDILETSLRKQKRRERRKKEHICNRSLVILTQEKRKKFIKLMKLAK